MGSGNIGLKLQELQFDFEEVAFADGAGLEASFADTDGVLKTVQILLGELQSGFGEKGVNELLRDVKDQSALGIGNL